MLAHVPPHTKYDRRQEGNGTRSQPLFTFGNSDKRTLRAETTRMHTIPARPSPPPRPPPMHCKRGMPTTCLLQYDPVHRLRITTRLKYAPVLLQILESTAINNHSPHTWKSKYAFNCGPILSYQVQFFWSMTNPVPSSDPVMMTKRFAPMTVLRRFVVIRYRPQDTASEDLEYRSI